MKKLVIILIDILAVVQSFSTAHLRPIGSITTFDAITSSESALCSVNNNEDQIIYNIDRRSTILGTVGSLFATTSLIASPGIASATSSIPQWTLEGGVRMPTLALNTVGLSTEESEKAVRLAVKEGMTHIDFHPGKERDGVAQYIAKEGRDGLFLNTKIRKAPPGTKPKDAAERTRNQIDDDLRALGLDSVDMLMLRDSPDCEIIQAQWAVLEEALAAGKTRSLGVINFCESALTCVLATAKVKPALNYYMMHVGMGRDPNGLRSFCDSKEIRSFAYGAIGEPGPNQELLSLPVLKKIAESHMKSPEATALRWVLQTGAAVSVRPSTNFGLGTAVCNDTSCQDGIQERAGSYSWSLTSKEMKELDALTSPDDNPTLFSSSGCPNAFVMPK